MDWITRAIAIGNYEDAQGDRPQKAGITAVLNLCLEREDFPATREFENNGIVYSKVPLWDSPKNPPEMLDAAVSLLSSLLSQGHRVLVHCGAGVSRSPTVVYLYLLRCGMSPREAKRLIREKRKEAIPNFDDFSRLIKPREVV